MESFRAAIGRLPQNVVGIWESVIYTSGMPQACEKRVENLEQEELWV